MGLTGLRVRYPFHNWPRGALLCVIPGLLSVAPLLIDSELTHSCPCGLQL